MKPLRVGIIQYYERVSEMHDIDKFMPPNLKKGNVYDMEDWTVHENNHLRMISLLQTMKAFQNL